MNQKSIYRKIWMACLLLMTCTGLRAATSITRLQTEYMQSPLGMDVARPGFSWQMQADGAYGVSQAAYRLVVAASEEALQTGNYVYDSGRVDTGLSVDRRYNGEALRPSTRYYWKVYVWDTKEEMHESAPAWFETGLLGGSWHGAQWIGSPRRILSPYRSKFTLEYDFTLGEGSREATFVLGAKSETQYVAITVSTKDKPRLTVSHIYKGKETVDHVADIDSIYMDMPGGTHHVKVSVDGPRGYDMRIELDGRAVKNAEPVANPMLLGYVQPDVERFFVDNDGADEPNANSRLYRIGYAQPLGETVVYSNIRISQPVWGETLYADDRTHRTAGNGKLVLWQPGNDVSAPMLRKQIDVRKPVKSARLYATARGVYEFSLNGQKVGRDYLNPGWTDYRYRLMYNTFDITLLLQQGSNGLGAMLGTGWYSDPVGFNANWQDQYGVRQSLRAVVRIDYTDGTTDYIVTDRSWKCYDQGPIVANSLQNGEDYDARKEVPGWTDGSFNDADWQPADIIPSPNDNTLILQGYVGRTVQSTVTLKARSVKKAGPRLYIYDMGQNMTGVPRLTGLRGKAGQTLTLHFAEMLYPEVIPEEPVAPYTVEMYREKQGQMYLENYRSALSTDHYTLKGSPEGETYEPRFTYHGYRYLSIEGLDQPLPLEQVEGIALESIGEQGSSFVTSDEHVNRLFENIVWGQRGNFLAVPTDCPQRDERMGWTGDAQVFARTATYNMNVAPFYTRWLYTLRDDQAASGGFGGYYPDLGNPPVGASPAGSVMCGGWQESGVIIPWEVYQQYGDVSLLEQHYPAMLKFMDYLERNATDYLQPFGGTGDWLAPEETNTMLTNTAYSAYAARIMEQVATVLEHEDDALRFATFFARIKEAFNRTFVNEEGYTVVPAEVARMIDPMNPMADLLRARQAEQPITDNSPVKVDTQTSYVLPLHFGLFDEKNKPLAIRHLREAIRRSGYKLTTGFVGTPYLCLVLSDNGCADDAYRLFMQTECPSWLFPVLQGATTMWERWNSYTVKNGFGPVSMNSFNHYAYGAIEEWMMSHCLGIQCDPQAPGYKHFFLAPEVGEQLDYATGGFETMYGRIESSWRREGKKITYSFTIPANTTATLTLPEDAKVLKGKEGILSRAADGKLELASGTYEFKL